MDKKLHFSAVNGWMELNKESRSDDFWPWLQVSVEHDEKHPHPKFGGDQFMGAWDMAAWIPN